MSSGGDCKPTTLVQTMDCVWRVYCLHLVMRRMRQPIFWLCEGCSVENKNLPSVTAGLPLSMIPFVTDGRVTSSALDTRTSNNRRQHTMAKDKPTRHDVEKAEAKLSAAALKAALKGDTERAKDLADKASLVRKLLQGQPKAK
jgi:hypothetical protein